MKIFELISSILNYAQEENVLRFEWNELDSLKILGKEFTELVK